MMVTPDETAAPLASALVRAGKAGRGRRIALSNGTASGSGIPLMERRAFLGTLAGGLLAAPLAAEAQQQAGKVFRIGVLYRTVPVSEMRGTDPPERLLRAFLHGLRDLGYVYGQQFVIEPRSAEGNDNRLPQLAAELVGLKVDVIFASTGAAARALKSATNTIPIVIAGASNPVEAGLVASLARPGGNITGLLSPFDGGMNGKRLELLKAAAPNISRVAAPFLLRAAAASLRPRRQSAAAGQEEPQLLYPSAITAGPQARYACPVVVLDERRVIPRTRPIHERDIRATAGPRRPGAALQPPRR